MSLDIDKLENVKRQGGGIAARCPACVEEGHDSKGDHLFVDQYGRYGCVIYPGKAEAAHTHRKRIFELVGIREGGGNTYIKVMEIKYAERPKIIESNVLGRLGHYKLSQDKMGNMKGDNAIKQSSTVNKSESDVVIGVPSVPGGSCPYTLDELMLMQPLDAKSLKIIHCAKICFEGTIIPSEPINIMKNCGKENGSSNVVTEGGEVSMRASEFLPFITPDADVTDGDTVTIVSNGTSQKFDDGNQRLQLKLKVPSGAVKLHTLNNTSLTALMGRLGDDVDKWVNKEVKVKIVQQNVKGSMKKVIYLSVE